MGVMTYGTIDLAKVGFVRIALFEILRLGLRSKFVHGAMTGEAATVLDCIANLGKSLAVTLGTRDIRLGM